MARYYNFKLAGQSPTVIATDGGFVGTPYRVDSLLIAPGERYEILVNAQQPSEIEAIAGLERKSRVLNPKEKQIVAYHEAGHAIIGSLMPGANRVEKISIAIHLVS